MADDILKQDPYPFHLALARELHLALCQMYPTSKGALFVGQKAGIAPYMINGDQEPYLVWRDLLQLAASSHLTRELVESAVADRPGSPPQLLVALLLQREPVIAREPRGVDGTPNFGHGADTVTEPEALLFHDDLSISIGGIDGLIQVLNRLRALAPAVCKLEVTCPIGIGSGTGFRIGPDLLLTNWHVLYPEGTRATAITATFGYEDDAQGVGLAGIAVPCDIASIKAGDDKEDWGVVRVSQPLAATIPTVLLPQAAVPKTHGSAFIIQHPGGNRKRVAYARNRITFVDTDVVQYLTDTQTGSSGSPVFNENGELISLHHAGGRPQEVAGKQPLRKNEGLRIERVVKGIRAAGINV